MSRPSDQRERMTYMQHLDEYEVGKYRGLDIRGRVWMRHQRQEAPQRHHHAFSTPSEIECEVA